MANEANPKVRVNRQILQKFTEQMFFKAGLTQKNAALAAQALVNADARGHESHGVARLEVYLDRIREGGSSATAEPIIVSDNGASAVVDGQNALGLVVGYFGMGHAIELSKKFGIGAVACRNSGHFGPAAEYALMGSSNDNNCITFSISNATKAMAPWGSISPILGNNPIAIAAPTGNQPFVLDMALSTVARGKIRLAAARGEEIPLGWGLDATGAPTTDAKAAIAGLITPLGGPKGSGLAIAFDIIAALLSGAATTPDLVPQSELARPQNVGHFFISIHIPHFVNIDEYISRVDLMLSNIRNSTPAAGVTQIYAPGDLEQASEIRANQEGIALQIPTWESLKKKAAELGVELPPTS
jgi:LDH2 family malate/lactate/ureidoglycolate dehydrogenase